MGSSVVTLVVNLLSIFGLQVGQAGGLNFDIAALSVSGLGRGLGRFAIYVGGRHDVDG